MSVGKGAGALVLLGALLTSTACGVKERVMPCDVLFDELQAVGRKMVAMSNGRSSFKPLSAADGPYFRDAAFKVRRIGERLDKEGPAETKKIAAEYDGVAAILEKLPPGATTTKYTAVIGEYDVAHINNETLKAACGYPPGVA
jgi:hypothetical protein